MYQAPSCYSWGQITNFNRHDAKSAPPMVNWWNDGRLRANVGCKTRGPAQEQFNRRAPRSCGPDVERRAECGIRPGGELKPQIRNLCGLT